MPNTGATGLRELLADAEFPAERDYVVRFAGQHGASADQLAGLATLPRRRYFNAEEVLGEVSTRTMRPNPPVAPATAPPHPSTTRFALGSLTAVAGLVGAVRTVLRDRGRKGIATTVAVAGIQTATAVGGAVASVLRWRQHDRPNQRTRA